MAEALIVLLCVPVAVGIVRLIFPIIAYILT